MKTASGIFSSRGTAEEAMHELVRLGLTKDQLSLLSPGKQNGEQDTVPTEDGEQPGMGKVIGGVVGGALGLSGGMPLGMVISSLLFPGIGPVVAIGFMTAAIAGSIGAAGGAAAGGALEYSLTEGLPRDELYFYEDALRQGRTILILRTDDDQQLEAGRKILTAAGAESIDAAREKWWIGLRDAEAESYDPSERSENFLKVESNYRKGFEAALDPSTRNKRYVEAQNDLKTRFPSLWDTPEFRAGYERGHEHAQNRLGRSEISSSAGT